MFDNIDDDDDDDDDVLLPRVHLSSGGGAYWQHE